MKYEDRLLDRFFDGVKIDDIKHKTISELIAEAEVFLDDSVSPEDYVKLNLQDIEGQNND